MGAFFLDKNNTIGYRILMQTVVETSYFIATCARYLTKLEHAAAIELLATYPEKGDVVAGTGGIRKIRLAASGRGKRGGARVIYFYHNADLPVFALAVYTKNTQDDLSADEKKQLVALAKTLKGD